MTKQIVTIYPVLAGVGGKYIATNLAASYAENHEREQVLLIDFDFHAPYLAGALIQDETAGIDNLIEQVEGGFINEESFRSVLRSISDNLFVLSGTNLGFNADMIREPHITKILEYAKQLFDKIYITVSSLPDNVGTTYGLFAAEEVLIVSGNDYRSYQQLPLAVQCVRQYSKVQDAVHAVYNQYNDQLNYDFPSFVRDGLVQFIEMIPYDENTVDNRHLKKTILSRFSSKKKKETVYDIINKRLFE